MFSVKQSKDILGAYCVFWVISMLVTVLTLIVKEPTSFAIFKIITAVVYGLHGAMGLEVFDELRQSGGLDNPEWNLFGIGQGFHGIFGIFLFFWALGSFCFSEPLNSLAPNKKLSGESGFRSRVFFYLVAVELMFVSALVVATALSYSHVPLNYSGCRTNRLDGTALEDMGDWMAGSAKQICTRTVTIQITGIMTCILAFLQAMCYVHLAAYPRIVRYIMYLIFHQAPPRHGYAVLEKKPHSYDIEKLLGYRLLSESPKLHDILADDTIAEKIASNLHFVDIANLSCTSGPVRQTMHGGKKKPSDKRLQLFCEAACEGGEKSECWACARMICKTCRYIRSQIYSPLTDSHAKNCFAVCTTCYILRAPALPAPKAALADSASLLNQHNDCWGRCSKREPMAEDVKLCKSCNLLGNLEVTEVREQRDAEALRRAHGGRLWCAECQKSLGKGRRRWFICETGGHECNWKGHQMC